MLRKGMHILLRMMYPSYCQRVKADNRSISLKCQISKRKLEQHSVYVNDRLLHAHLIAIYQIMMSTVKLFKR